MTFNLCKLKNSNLELNNYSSTITSNNNFLGTKIINILGNSEHVSTAFLLLEIVLSLILQFLQPIPRISVYNTHLKVVSSIILTIFYIGLNLVAFPEGDIGSWSCSILMGIISTFFSITYIPFKTTFILIYVAILIIIIIIIICSKKQNVILKNKQLSILGNFLLAFILSYILFLFNLKKTDERIMINNQNETTEEI